MTRGKTGALAAAVLLAAAGPAAAFKFQLGDGFDGHFDSTLSFGLQLRAQGASCHYIGLDNGGCAALSAEVPEASQDAYYLNADDGNLNYGKHDLYSEVFKGTHELQLKMPEGFSFFGRISELYDARIGETARTPLTAEAKRYSVYNVLPLDAYLNKDFEWFDRSARLRVGWQVLSWGEDIFTIGGINSINAIDVRRYHVAGAQVKEILRPAPIVALNTALVDQWNFEGYWQWHWNSFRLDPNGTYFESADPVGKGNPRAIFIPTSAINAGLDANPVAAALLAAGAIRHAPAGTVGDPGGTGLSAQQLQNPAFVGPRLIDGLTNPNFAGLPGLTVPVLGNLGGLGSRQIATLLVQNFLNTGTAIPLASDSGASNHGQYGASLRYRPDWIEASFGFYFERYNSKIPFVSYLVDPAYASANPLSAAYRIEYPGGIDLYGVSYNASVGDWALGGELSWRPRDPVAIDPSVPTGADPKSAPYACLQDATAPFGTAPKTGEQNGKYCRGWVDRSKFQLHQTALQIFNASDGLGSFFLPTFAASEGYFLFEAVGTDYPGLDRKGGIPWALPGYSLPNKFSLGYVTELQLTYPNVLNLGFDWLPQIDWSQGVLGNSPNAIPWQAGAKAATFTLNFNRQNRVTAALSYSWFWGGGTKNQTSDRDYAGFTVAYNF